MGIMESDLPILAIFATNRQKFGVKSLSIQRDKGSGPVIAMVPLFY